MLPDLALDFLDIRQRLKQCALPDVDRVIGIGSGGIVPAALVAFELARPLSILVINFRASDNAPRYSEPQVMSNVPLVGEDEHLLLVDDVSVSGKTMAMAKEVLRNRRIITLVLKGQADIVLFPEIEQCVQWPWKPAI